MTAPRVTVIGGGFAGVECASVLARRGHRVRLVEMRPVRTTDAHETDRRAEMVCSNSFRSDNPGNAVGLLKREMELLGSLVHKWPDSPTSLIKKCKLKGFLWIKKCLHRGRWPEAL